MNGELIRVLRLKQPLEERFILEDQIVQLPGLVVRRAIDPEKNQPVTVFYTRTPFVTGENRELQFFQQIERVLNVSEDKYKLSGFGVDINHLGFFYVDPLDGELLYRRSSRSSEVRRRFISSLQRIREYHEQSIVFGSIVSESFWMDRSGTVHFIDFPGITSLPIEAFEIPELHEFRSYFAPEILSGEAPTVESDLYSLGKIGEKLFLQGTEGNQNYPSQLKVLQKCTALDPGDRYQSCRDFLEAFRTSHHGETEAELPEQVSRLIVPVKEQKDGVVSYSAPIRMPGRSVSEKGKGTRSILSRGVLVTFAGASLLCFALLFWLFQKQLHGGSRLREELSVHRSLAIDEGIKTAIDVLSEDDISLQEKRRELETLVESNDPVAHDILVKSAQEAKSDKLRQLSELMILERVRRLGLPRSAEQVRQWLRTSVARERSENYERILHSIDPGVPLEERLKFLEQAFDRQPNAVLRITTALMLDKNDPDSYRSMLSHLVSKSISLEDPERFSAGALILLHPQLALVYGDDIAALRDGFSDEDIVELLQELAERSDIHVQVLAQLARERNLISPLRQTFLSPIVERNDVPFDVVSSLVSGALGKMNSEHLGSFGRWFDLEAEKVLLAISADEYPDKLIEETFDVLAARSPETEPAASIIEWVRKSYPEQRSEFGRLMGMLTYFSLVDKKRIQQSLQNIRKVVNDDELVSVFIETEDPAVLKTLLENFSEAMSLGLLLDFLKQTDPEVRIMAVKALGRYNDVGALKLIIDEYEKEKDASVRKVYQETFWVIKRREKKPL